MYHFVYIYIYIYMHLAFTFEHVSLFYSVSIADFEHDIVYWVVDNEQKYTNIFPV